MGVTGGGAVALGYLAVDIGLAVNNPSSSSVRSSPMGAACLALVLVGGGADASGCLAADEGLIVNNPSSSDSVSESRSKPGLDDYNSNTCMYVIIAMYMAKI